MTYWLQEFTKNFPAFKTVIILSDVTISLPSFFKENVFPPLYFKCWTLIFSFSISWTNPRYLRMFLSSSVKTNKIINWLVKFLNFWSAIYIAGTRFLFKGSFLLVRAWLTFIRIYGAEYRIIFVLRIIIKLYLR